MKKFLILLSTLFLLFSIVGLANALPITSLYSTGIDDAGNPLTLGSNDTHYEVLETGSYAQVLAPPHSSYYPNDNNSEWIWQQSNSQPTYVDRTFRTTFDLTEFDPSTAIINGLWGTDNQGIDILLNGVSTGNNLLGVTASNFTQMHSFVIDSGFQSGINTLDFIIRDNGVVSGFRAELYGEASENAPVPEPATFFLVALGLTGLIGLGRRKKQLQS